MANIIIRKSRTEGVLAIFPEDSAARKENGRVLAVDTAGNYGSVNVRDVLRETVPVEPHEARGIIGVLKGLGHRKLYVFDTITEAMHERRRALLRRLRYVCPIAR